MFNREISRQHQRLVGLFKQTRDVADGDPSIQSHWARYLCILVSGFLENAIKEIYSDYIQSGASKPVASYATRQLVALNNPKADKVIQLATSFKQEWGSELTAFMAENGRKDAIDSIMNNRHQIAHGKEVGLTIHNLSDYFERVVQTVGKIEEQCLR